MLRDDETYYGTRTRVTLSDERQSISISFKSCSQYTLLLRKNYFLTLVSRRIGCFDKRNDACAFHFTGAFKNELCNLLSGRTQRFHR